MPLKPVDNVSFNQTSLIVHLKHLKAVGRMSKSLSVSRNEPELMLNQMELGATGTIVVMICRMWDVNSSTGRYLSTDFIVSDKEALRIVCFLSYVSTIPDMLYLSSTSPSLIIDDEKIPVLKRLKHDDSSGLELTKEVLPSDNTLPKPKTLENLLMWARNRKYDSATFHCDVKIDKIRTKNEAVEHKDIFINPHYVHVQLPTCRHRLEIKISDDTAEVVVVLFDETSTSLLKCFGSAMVASQAQRIITDDVVEGGSNSDMVAAKADSKSPEVESLNKNLLLSTPYKPTEEKKHRRLEKLEDSDVEESFVADISPKEMPWGVLSTPRKKEDMNSDSNHLNLPSLSNILHTSMTIHSNAIVRRDGNIHSFCGLKLSDIHTPHTGTEVSYHSLGAPSYQCHNCNATMWYEERNNKGKRITNPTFSLCCQEGKVLLPQFIETPEPLRRLLDYIEPATSRFRDHIRVYNGMFCFTSFRARIDHSINVGRGLYTFCINSQNYHRIGSLLPQEGTQPRYPQLWFFDTQNELRNRLNAFIDNETGDSVDGTTVGSLIEMLDRNSAIAQAFRMARYWCHSHSSVNVELRLLSKRKSLRKYNAPTVVEVAALITNNFGDGDPTRDIIVNTKDDGYHDKILYHRNTAGLGKRIVLPHTFIGGPRYMMQNYQDVMALCRAYGNPDMFITFMSNPKWPEINEMLVHVPGQRAHDRPEVGTKVFKLKLTELLEDLTKNKIFGESRVGPDRATIVIHENVPNGQADTTEKVTVIDEIKNYLNCRYLAPCEAVWCMLSFDIRCSYPSVMKQNFHLPNQQPVTLCDSDNLPALLEREGIASLLLPAGRTAHSREGGEDNEQCRDTVHWWENLSLGFIRKQDFNQWVLAIGDGKLPAKMKDKEDEPTWIQIPEKFLINASDSPIA
uniref:Helicase-like protein n=1 Tax=Tanacetum cinerariifolium TaxID=118510 RepID=A0A6L2J0R6_TANCI|nr:helicase-like protein [Tanacetum cinerariifolium]